MTYHNCPVCYHPVRHPQQVTCGGTTCKDSWRNFDSQARFSRQNLAAMSPSERNLCLAQGPSDEELEAKAAARDLLEAELEQHQINQQKAETPKFLREMMAPDNLTALIKEEPKHDSNTNNSSPNPPK